MRSVVINEYGGNDVIRLIDVDPPQPGVGEVLVRVSAAGINPVDWKIRNGAGRRMGLTLPIRLGGEIAGTVEALGEGVARLASGDAVYGIVGSGGFADYVVTPAANLARKPSNLDFTQAAGVALGALTAWQAMFDVAKLAAGQRLFITNGSGGVGSLAVQIAKASGAHVTAMCSARNADYVRSLGADAFVDRDAQPFEQVVRDMDVVFDTVGEDVYERAFSSLRRGGFLVTAVAFPRDEGERYGVGVGRVICKPDGGQLASIGEMIEAGALRPRLGRVLPLDRVKEALDLSEGGQAGGKLVLRLVD